MSYKLEAVKHEKLLKELTPISLLISGILFPAGALSNDVLMSCSTSGNVAHHYSSPYSSRKLERRLIINVKEKQVTDVSSNRLLRVPAPYKVVKITPSLIEFKDSNNSEVAYRIDRYNLSYIESRKDYEHKCKDICLDRSYQGNQMSKDILDLYLDIKIQSPRAYCKSCSIRGQLLTGRCKILRKGQSLFAAAQI